MDKVILVDENDSQIGLMEKLEAHQKGKLHRAFSVVLNNSKGELLLQKRALVKYHSGGLWTNTCCSHPQPDEPIEVTVRKKLMHEMGIDFTPQFLFKFTYRAILDNGLIENEIDHVFTGIYDGVPSLNPYEAENWEFISLEKVLNNISVSPEKFSPWFSLILKHPAYRLA